MSQHVAVHFIGNSDDKPGINSVLSRDTSTMHYMYDYLLQSKQCYAYVCIMNVITILANVSVIYGYAMASRQL